MDKILNLPLVFTCSIHLPTCINGPNPITAKFQHDQSVISCIETIKRALLDSNESIYSLNFLLKVLITLSVQITGFNDYLIYNTLALHDYPHLVEFLRSNRPIEMNLYVISSFEEHLISVFIILYTQNRVSYDLYKMNMDENDLNNLKESISAPILNIKYKLL